MKSSPIMFWKLRAVVLLLHITTVTPQITTKEPPEPFQYLNNVCLDCGPAVPLSPDPLVQAQWSSSTNIQDLQIYRVAQPVAITVHPPHAIEGWQDWLFSNSNDNNNDEATTTVLTITEPCNLTIDWGVERAAWLEFQWMPNHTNDRVPQAGLSEFNTPYPGKTKIPVQYDSNYYRLETNEELYEGVRYTFFYFHQPTVISNISLAAKIKPVPYTGYYASSDDTLTQSWYTGAYGVRLNMESTQFNSILIERGDRVAIQGDAHPSMATALVGFGSPPVFEFVQSELWQTNSGHVHGHNVVDQAIMAYPLYWCLSVLDWYWASGNHTGFQELVPDVRSILDIRVDTFLDLSQDIVWMGWDDRLGNGWCSHSNNDTCPIEGHWTLAGLVTRVCKDLAKSLEAVGDNDLAKQYQGTYQKLIEQFRSKVPPTRVGVHAAANIINAGIVEEGAIEEWIQTKLNNAGTLCSWSPFNQYWILQALAHDMERGLASIELCWGPMLKINKGCFWELSSPDWPTFLKEGDMPPTMPSLCHPWASGVTAWLSHVHGGIQPLLPGYEQALVAPYVSVNYPNVTTTMPTPHGSVTARATLDGNHVLRMEVQNPVNGYIGLRDNLVGACGFHKERVLLNGTLVPLTNLLTSTDLTGLKVPSHAQNLTFISLSQGRHTLTVPYACHKESKTIASKATKSPFPPTRYPASVTFDRESRGDGLKRYGSDGFMLLGYKEDQTDLEHLPNYVESLQIRNHGWGGWGELARTHLGSSEDNPTYLPNPLNASAPRALGAIGYGEPGYWNPGILVDVELKEHVGARMLRESMLVDIQTKRQPFQMSIYCVGDGKHAVRFMDMESLDPIAHTVSVEEYGEGVWYTVSYTKSIRLRTMAMYGIQISAIAFATPTEGVEQATALSANRLGWTKVER